MKLDQDIKVSVSIVVPVYNVEQYLHRCLKSLINQNFSSYEIILVDDGSTDDSGKICDDYAYELNVVKVVHKKNGGLSSARLAGFREACGKYICFIDSDDYLKENYISDLYSIIVDHNADMCICAYSYEKDGKQIDYFLPKNKSCITDIKQEFVLPILSESNSYSCKMLPNFMWLRMIKSEIISEDMFVSERDVYQEDLVFNLLISKKLKCISLINKPNYVYCYNGKSLTEKYRKNAWNMQINLYSFIKDFCTNNSIELSQSLNKRLINAVIFTVRNASKSDYQTFFNDIVKMKNDDLFSSAVKIFKYRENSKSNKMIFFCLKFGLYRLIYFLFNHYKK